MLNFLSFRYFLFLLSENHYDTNDTDIHIDRSRIEESQSYLNIDKYPNIAQTIGKSESYLNINYNWHFNYNIIDLVITQHMHLNTVLNGVEVVRRKQAGHK